MNEPLMTRFRSKLRNTMDQLVDWHLKIDTLAGTGELSYSASAGKFEDNNQNVSVNYYNLYRFLESTTFKPDDIFYDIGCGNGRVLCYVARKRVAKVVGVELSRAFADKSEANARKLRGRISPIEVRCADATEVDYSGGTIFYLANPFGAETMRSVLAKIHQSAVSHPRPMCFLYYNPVHTAVFQASGWLKLVGRRDVMFSMKPMEVWTNDYRAAS